MRPFVVILILPVAVVVCDAQWVQTNGPSGGYVQSLAVSGMNLFAGTTNSSLGGGIFLSTDNGTNWISVDSGLVSRSVHALAVSGASLFAGTSDSGVFRSTDNGISWTSVNNGLTNRRVDALAISGDNLFAGTLGSGVFLSTNSGTSWNSTSLINAYVYTLAVSDANLLAGTSGDGVFLTTNGGIGWTSVGLTNTFVYSLGVSGTTLFAGTNLGIFVSSNSGTTWTAVNSSHKVLVFAALTGNIFAGTDTGGVFLSTNNGTNWSAVNDGWAGVTVHALAFSDTNLFAGTGGRGVWRRSLSEMITSVQLPATDMPAQFSLEQNYPNPFNPSTTIHYGLPHCSFVTLTVYNTLGQQVAQLVNEQLQAGYHETVFLGDGLASGVYFYCIQAGDFVAGRKLLLLK